MTRSTLLKKNYRTFFYYCLLALIAVACSDKETPNGMKYKLVKSGGSDVNAKKGEFLVFDYTMVDSKDSVWASTYEKGMPGAAMIEDSTAIPTENGLSQMFRVLGVGDSVSVKMPVPKFFKDVVGSPILPRGVDSTLTLTLTMHINDIMTRDAYIEYITNLQNTADGKAIDEYLKAHNVSAQTDSTGIRYVIHRSTGAAKPTEESCVKLTYAGRFLQNDRVFDQGTASYPVRGFIQGWQKALPLMSKGDSATFYIPSALAYGPQGSQGVIPPNAVLIFEVALIDFTATFDPKAGTCK